MKSDSKLRFIPIICLMLIVLFSNTALADASKAPASRIKMQSSLTVTAGFKAVIETKLKKPNKEEMKKVVWSSSNEKVATVSKKGRVTGIKPGKSTITCTLNNGRKYKCAVKVVNNIVFSNKYSKLKINKKKGPVYVVPVKTYYKGKSFVSEFAVFNNMSYAKLERINELTLTFTTGDEKVIASRSFKNIKLGIDSFGKKKIKFKFPEKYVKKANYNIRGDAGITFTITDMDYTYKLK